MVVRLLQKEGTTAAVSAEGATAGGRLYLQEENDQVDHHHRDEADEPEFHVSHLR